MSLWPAIYEWYRGAAISLLGLPILGCLVALLYAVTNRRAG